MGEIYSDLDDLLEARSGRFEDNTGIATQRVSLVSNSACCQLDLAVLKCCWHLAGHEDEAICFDGLRLG